MVKFASDNVTFEPNGFAYEYIHAVYGVCSLSRSQGVVYGVCKLASGNDLKRQQWALSPKACSHVLF